MRFLMKNSWSLGFWPIIAAATALLSGCTTVGPDYNRPSLQVLDRWMQADGERV